MKRIIANWFPPAFCGVLIFYLSSRPVNTIVAVKYFDKVAHILFYSFFAYLIARASRVKVRVHKFWFSMLLIILITSYGMIIEWYQMFIPTRDPSLADNIANFAGACLGLLIYAILHNFRKSKNVRKA